MEEVQLQTNSLSGKIKQLMISEELYDITFIAGNEPDQKKFYSHKLLLSVCSDVFRNMFNDSSNKIDEIHIPEVEPHIFQMVLNYIYTENLETDDMDDAIKIFYVANKYVINELLNASREIIKEKLNSQNVCLVYDMAIQTNDEILQNKSEYIIKKDTTKVLESYAFLKCPLSIVQKITTSNFLNVPDELFLFVAVMKWVREEAKRQNKELSARNLRKIIDPILPHIRFLSMTHNQLFGSPARSGIITQEEIMNIAMHLSEPKLFPTLPDWCNLNKNNRIGSVKPDILYRLAFNQNCFSSIENNKKTGKLKIKCCMIPSWTNIILKGFSLCVKRSTKIQPNLFISASNESYRLIEYAIAVKNENSSQKMVCDTYEMRLLKPFLMQKWNYYYIKIKSDDTIVMCNECVPCDKFYNLSYLGITYLNNNNCHFHEILCSIAQE